MQEIADWLKKLGLPEYAQRFCENGIDFSVLQGADTRRPSDRRLRQAICATSRRLILVRKAPG
jgi:hypothetical protein